MRYMVLAMVIIVSCSGVAIKKVNSIPTLPQYLMTLAAPFAGILFENSIKNKAKLAERKIIPAIAQKRAVFSEPLSAFSPKRLLI